MLLSFLSAFLAAATKYGEDAALRAQAERLIALCRESLDDGNGALVVDNALCFSGHTEAETLQAFERVADEPFDVIVLRSAGGDVDIALTIAERLVERRALRAYVWDYCMSSCANWLLLAAEEKVQTDPNLVTWHGGPRAPENFTAAQEPYRAALTRLYERSIAFYRRVGVDPSIMYQVPDGFAFDFDNASMSFWVVPKASLEEAGVTGLLIYDGAPRGDFSILIR